MSSIEILTVTYEEFMKNGLPRPTCLVIDGKTRFVITDIPPDKVDEVNKLFKEK